jgi:hypothetical protein
MLRVSRTGLPMILLLLLFLLMSGCTAPTSPETTPVVMTVVETVPVEVTRQVEVTRFVEVTRQVIVTQLVEIVVTPTPQTATSTPIPTETIKPLTPFPTLLSTAKIGGSTTPKGSSSVPFFIENQTDDPLVLNLYGPKLLLTLSIGKDEVRKTFLKEASYTYEVLRDDQRLYAGEFTINNFDKHEFFLRENKAVLWIP